MKKYNYFLFLFLTIILFINIFFLKNHNVNRFLLSPEKEYKAEDEKKIKKGKRLNSYLRRRILFFLLLLLFLVFLVIIFFELHNKYKKKVEEEEEKTVFNDLNLILNLKEVNLQTLYLAKNSKGHEIKQITNNQIFVSNKKDREFIDKIDDGKTYIIHSTKVVSKVNGKYVTTEIKKINEINRVKNEAEKKMRIKGAAHLLNRFAFKKINDAKREFMLNLDSIRFVFYGCFFSENFNYMFAEQDFIENQKQNQKFLLCDVTKYKEDKDGILFNQKDEFKHDGNIYYFDYVDVDDKYGKRFALLSYEEGNDKKNKDYYFFSQEIFWDDNKIYEDPKNKNLIGTIIRKKRRCFPFATDHFGKRKMIETKNKLINYFKTKNIQDTKKSFFTTCFTNVFADIDKRVANYADFCKVNEIKAKNQEKDYLYFYTADGDYLKSKKMTDKEKNDYGKKDYLYFYTADGDYLKNKKMTDKEKNDYCDYYCQKKFYPCLVGDEKMKCKMITKVENAQGRHFVLEELSKGNFYILENIIENVKDLKKNGGVYVLPEPNAFSDHSLLKDLKYNLKSSVVQLYIDNLSTFLNDKNIVGGIMHVNARRIKKNKTKKKITEQEVSDYLNREYYNGDKKENEINNKKEKKDEAAEEISNCLSIAKKTISVFNFSNYNPDIDKYIDQSKREEFYETELKIRKILNKNHRQIDPNSRSCKRNTWQKKRKIINKIDDNKKI